MSRENINTVRIVRPFLTDQWSPNWDIYNLQWEKKCVGYYMYRWFIPPNEIWLEQDYEDELDQLLRIIAVGELATFAKYDDERKFLKKYLLPEKVDPAELALLIQREERLASEILVQYVDGALVRKLLDPHFVYGGHFYRYSEYISDPNIVWIDNRVNVREQKFILHHELVERKLMKRGQSYDYAHDRANIEEKQMRRKHGAAFPGEDGNIMRENGWGIEELKDHITVKLIPLEQEWGHPVKVLGPNYREILSETQWQNPQM